MIRCSPIVGIAITWKGEKVWINYISFLFRKLAHYQQSDSSRHDGPSEGAQHPPPLPHHPPHGPQGYTQPSPKLPGKPGKTTIVDLVYGKTAYIYSYVYICIYIIFRYIFGKKQHEFIAIYIYIYACVDFLDLSSEDSHVKSLHHGPPPPRITPSPTPTSKSPVPSGPYEVLTAFWKCFFPLFFSHLLKNE